MQMIELERTYVLSYTTAINIIDSQKIKKDVYLEQFYMVAEQNYEEKYVYRRNYNTGEEDYFKMVKVEKGVDRTKTTTPVSREEYLQKREYEKISMLICRDVYNAILNYKPFMIFVWNNPQMYRKINLVTAEVEFENKEDFENYELINPGIVDVTGNDAFRVRNMAIDPRNTLNALRYLYSNKFSRMNEDMAMNTIVQNETSVASGSQELQGLQDNSTIDVVLNSLKSPSNNTDTSQLQSISGSLKSAISREAGKGTLIGKKLQAKYVDFEKKQGQLKDHAELFYEEGPNPAVKLTPIGNTVANSGYQPLTVGQIIGKVVIYGTITWIIYHLVRAVKRQKEEKYEGKESFNLDYDLSSELLNESVQGKLQGSKQRAIYILEESKKLKQDKIVHTKKRWFDKILTFPGLVSIAVAVSAGIALILIKSK